MNEEKLNAVQSLIGVLNSPIAQRQGYSISAEDCKIWVEELTKFLEQFGWHPASKLPPVGRQVVVSFSTPDGVSHAKKTIYNSLGEWLFIPDDAENLMWCYQPQND